MNIDRTKTACLPNRLSFRVPRSTFPVGFTLVELLVVIIIILMLAAVLMPALSGARRRAQKVASQSQLKNIADACESYAISLRTYPSYFSNTEIDTMGATGDFTANENFVLALMGQVRHTDDISDSDDEYVPSGSSIPSNHAIDLSNVGSGPKDQNSKKVYAPFYSAKTDELVAIQGTTSASPNKMMELCDVSSGMPILMWKVNTSTAMEPPVGDTFTDGQVSMAANVEYTDAPGLKRSNEDDKFEQANQSLLYSMSDSPLENLAWMLIDKNVSNTSNGVNNTGTIDDIINGAYAFLSPGPDGIYLSQYQLDPDDPNNETISTKQQLSNFDDLVYIGGSR